MAGEIRFFITSQRIQTKGKAAKVHSTTNWTGRLIWAQQKSPDFSRILRGYYIRPDGNCLSLLSNRQTGLAVSEGEQYVGFPDTLVHPVSLPLRHESRQ